jgi:dihydrolipoamide dehydrogenase
MATVYHELGSKVTIVELMDQIIPGADKDMVTPLFRRIAKQYEAIHLKAKVTRSRPDPKGWSSASRAAARPPPTLSTRSWWPSAAGRTAG